MIEDRHADNMAANRLVEGDAMMDIKAGMCRNLPNQVRLSQTIPEDTGKTTTRSRHPNVRRSLMVVALITLPHRIASRLSAVFLLLLAVPALVKPASAQDPSCKPVLDAVVLQARTSSHVYSTMTGSSGNMTSETITTNEAEYTKTIPPGGSWRKSSYSPKNQAEQAAQVSRSYTSCQHVGDETVKRRGCRHLHRD
jgi:hypothetical protein